MKTLSARDNPRLKQLRKLLDSAGARREAACTVLDGVHLLRAALDAGVTLGEVYVAEAACHHPEVAAILKRCGALPVYCVADPLFAALSPANAACALLATLPLMPPTPVLPEDGDCLLLDGVQDAGNVGTLMRSAAAAGIGVVLLGPGCAQAWSPKVLRAGMGAHFVLAVHEVADLGAAMARYRGQVVVTRLDASTSLYDADLRAPLAWLLGAEGRGVSAELAARADFAVHIPMAPGVESLNVAAAAAICLFEQRRQRRVT